MPHIMDVENEQIGRLRQDEAVQFFGDLLNAEARRLGIGPEIRVSGRINVPDGGVDASVNNTEAAASNLIKSGYNGFQIKTGSTFAITEAPLRKELFGDKEVALENLGLSVRHCLDKNGHFIFVCFGLDPTEEQNLKAIALVEGWLKQCGFASPSIQIWGQGTIRGFLGVFPALVFRVTQRSPGPLEIFEMWERHSDMKPDTLSIGDVQKGIMQAVQTDLATNAVAVRTRIIGESGVGKTRLALEILKDERLRPLVLYTDRPAELEGIGFLTELMMPNCNLEIILVLDECPREVESYYWNRLEALGKRIRLVTIYNNEEKERTNIAIPPLTQAEIVAILNSYGLPAEHVTRWATFCEGSPRWAHIIGSNIKSNAGDVLKDPDNVPVISRYITGPDNQNDQRVKDRLIVIRYLALFKRFGYKGEVAAEATAIFDLIRKYDTSITRASFDEAINVLHERRILQGEKTYYITPKPLHIKLWAEWWDNHNTAFNFSDFNKLPPLLSRGFNDMLRFAQESDAAKQTVEKLLGKGGPFEDGRLLESREGGDFFLALAEASPEKALQRLEETVGQWDVDRLKGFKEGRMSIIWALERITVWKGLFTRATAVLLKLAEAENEFVYSNNATGTFKSLFSVFSATEESPSVRLPIIEKLIASKDPIKEDIAIRAISVALDHHFSRMIGAEYQGARREPDLWNARAHPEETREYIAQVWALVMKYLGKVYPQNKKALESVFFHQIKVLGRNPDSSAFVLADAKTIDEQKAVDKKDLIETVVHILHYGTAELPEGLKILWRDFYNELVPKNDFAAQLQRHVALNLTEDLFDEKGVYSEEGKNRVVDELAAQAYQNTPALLENLSWLVTREAQNGYSFGYALGKSDKEQKLLDAILDVRRKTPEEKNPSQFFLGGYLRALYEDSPQKWIDLFNKLSKDELYVKLLPELVWRAGINDAIAETLTILIENDSVPATSLGFFRYGTSVRDLSRDTFEKWIRLLISQKDRWASSIALDIFERYFGDQGATAEMSKDLAFEVLADPTLFAVGEGGRDTMDDFIWGKIAARFIKQFGEDKKLLLKIGFLMLDSLGNKGSILDHSEKYVQGILQQISDKFPDEMWIRALENMEEKGYFIFKQWLSANSFFGASDSPSPLLEKIKLDILWKWIDEKPNERAWFIASLVPNNFTNESGKVCLTRELLIRYGDRDDVKRNLMANFYTEGWSGEASIHYQKKLTNIKPFRENETDPNVIRWLDLYIDQLKASIESAKTGEEREEWR
jgi:hypothetical protein